MIHIRFLRLVIEAQRDRAQTFKGYLSEKETIRRLYFMIRVVDLRGYEASYRDCERKSVFCGLKAKRTRQMRDQIIIVC